MFGLIGRLAYLQIWKGKHYSELAQAQRMRPRVIDPQRGSILDRNYKTLAISIGADAVYAIPGSIPDPAATAQKLAPYLSLSEEELTMLLNTDSQRSVWLERGLSPDAAEQIRQLNLSGIRLVERPQRYYPNGTLAAHVLGIAGIDNQGLEGLEYQYDEVLRGVPGQLALERDAAQRSIPGGMSQYSPPQDGYDLVLTLDTVIQHIAESEIKRAVESTESERGLILIMDPCTGEILANAIYPTFDPNNYSQFSLETRRNIAITDQYEPGSTFKFVTASAALDLGITSQDREFYSGPYWEVGGGRVRNWDGRGSGNINFLQAIESSDNITFAQLSVEMGPERFYPYIRGFGFGSRLGVDFPGESSGTVVAPGEVRHGETIRWANIGFGQGIAVTPIQLLAAIGAVANDGVLMKPYFVKEIRDQQGKLIDQTVPEEISQVISVETARQVARLLRSVVVNGGGSRADIAGYYVAGKTGTAEVPEGGGYGEGRIASFVGYAPVDDPVLAGLVILYHPETKNPYGGVHAAPVFQTVVEESLSYLGVERRKEASKRTSMAVVPNVRNFSLLEAQAKLAHENLQWTYEGDGALVSDQVPNPGTRVPPQTTVRLYFYEEEIAQEVSVPSVVGQSMRDASSILSEEGLYIRIIGSGMARKQTPAAGAKVPYGSVIEVEFSP